MSATFMLTPIALATITLTAPVTPVNETPNLAELVRRARAEQRSRPAATIHGSVGDYLKYEVEAA